MAELGSFVLLLALALSAYSFVAGLAALIRRQPGSERLSETARRAGIASFGAVFLGAGVLVTAAFRNDFSIAYIFHHSNRDLPLPYKFATLWSGQEGSLLFWSLLLSGYGLVLRLRHKTDARLFAHASVVIAAVQVFFLLLLNFAAHPFAIMQGTLPADGNGLNPLLQYAEMVIHPPMLYLGYVGFTVPFAFALGALAMKYPGEKWIHITRRWTMVTWGFLTCGVFLGAHWANSVHAFAQSSIGDWFVSFLAVILATCLYFYAKNRSHLRSEHKLESLVSRESSFLFNNLLLLLACFTVLWGTLFPVLSEWVQGHKVTVGPPFFNKVTIPVALLLLLLTAVGPLLAWRKTSFESLKRNFLWPSLGALAVGAFLIATPSAWGGPFGLRPWNDVSYFYSLMAIMLSVLVALTVISEFVRGGRVISGHTGQGLASSLRYRAHRNTRRYGGYVVHLGVIIVFIGFAGSAFNREAEKEMSYGDKLDIGAYTIVGRSYTQEEKPNYSADLAILQVFKDGKQIDTLYPESRFYPASGEQQHMPAVRSTLKEDLYLVYEGQNPDTGRPIIKAHLNPLVSCIWVGVLVMVFGTISALVPNAAPVRALVRQSLHADIRVRPAPVGAGD